VYTALVSNRPYRRGMLPYHAIEQMIRDASYGRFDPVVVRALVETIGLFPVGSLVLLNNGLVARVLRTNRFRFDQPIVEAWKPTQLSSRPTLIDLSQEPTIHVVRAITNLKAV
jgi:hypothetical protein